MKRIGLYILFLSLTLLTYAQEFDYPTRVIDGKTVYEYPVKKSEGLYRISVNFGCTQEELLQLNPSLRTEGLKFGQVIYVPVKEKTLQKAEKGVTKKGDMSRQPSDTLKPEAKPVLPENNQLMKMVKPLPVTQPEPVAAQPAPEPTPAPDTTVIVLEPAVTELSDTVASVVFQDTLRLALLLPLQADAQSYDVKMERFLKFYEGALLAIRQEQRSEWKYEIYVYDVGKTEYKLRKVLEQPEMLRVNAIIGPAYSEQVPAAGAFARAHNIPCLLPFTSDVESLESNPFLLQYNPVVPEGMKAVQFKKQSDSWARFDELMETYFNTKASSQSRPRYDILGYDLTRYFIPAVLRAMQADTDDEWQEAFETVHDGLQSTLQFKRVGEGGYMNTPLRLVRKISNIDEIK